MDKVLLDTSGLFALFNPEDAHHRQALEINDRLIQRQVALILPNFLLAESHTIINKRLGPRLAREFLNAALLDFQIERITIEDEWAAHAMLQTVSRRRNLSYFDAVAIALAIRLDVLEVFSFDQHFRLMGLKPVSS
jgi:predicted nucleic acid-binding protein